MERAFYFWTGLILTSFFGFFAVWIGETSPGDGSPGGLFWFSAVGTGIGLTLLLVAVIATAVRIGCREASGDSRRD